MCCTLKTMFFGLEVEDLCKMFYNGITVACIIQYKVANLLLQAKLLDNSSDSICNVGARVTLVDGRERQEELLLLASIIKPVSKYAIKHQQITRSPEIECKIGAPRKASNSLYYSIFVNLKICLDPVLQTVGRW